MPCQPGAELDYKTTDPKLVAALHKWFDAQLSDHGSDAMEGSPAPPFRHSEQVIHPAFQRSLATLKAVRFVAHLRPAEHRTVWWTTVTNPFPVAAFSPVPVARRPLLEEDATRYGVTSVSALSRQAPKICWLGATAPCHATSWKSDKSV